MDNGEFNCRQEAQFKDFLRELLGPVRKAHEALLQFDVDSLGLVKTTYPRFLNALPSNSERACWQNAEFLISGLNTLLNDTLSQREYDDERKVEGSNAVIVALAAWLDHQLKRCNAIDPMAVEILWLQCDGLENRDIAIRLETGLRLVNQITSDLMDTRNNNVSC